ncbi:MAG TPA: hypothetical protein VL147_01625 [Devosia sp.]|nr:hypothetical protein [Devosia sp.]
MTRAQLRRRAEAMIDELIGLLDALDGDPDAEVETDFDLNPISLQAVDRVPAKRIRRAA